MKTGQNRDTGLRGGGAGKGSAPRYKHDENWVENFSAIDWHRHQEDNSDTREFEQLSPKRWRKRYGAPAKQPESIEVKEEEKDSRCSYCNGRGGMSNDSYSCGGMSNDSYSYFTCPWCNGSGKSGLGKRQ